MHARADCELQLCISFVQPEETACSLSMTKDFPDAEMLIAEAEIEESVQISKQPRLFVQKVEAPAGGEEGRGGQRRRRI